MSKLLTVIGATGAQGGSVVAAALKSGVYKIRGVTRNVDSDASKALVSKGVEMVTADVNDESSLLLAFEGSHAVFAITNFFSSFAAHDAEETIEIEAQQGINLAKAASKTPSLRHYIWSSLPDNIKITDGKCRVPHFESKVKVDQFIKRDEDLLMKTTFLWMSYYSNNMVMPMMVPNLFRTSGKYLQVLPVADDTPITTTGDIRINAGIYALAVLDQLQLTLPGKIVLVEAETRTTRDIIKLWSDVSGKPAEYCQISLDHYDNLWPKWGREIGLTLQFWDAAREKSWTADQPVLTKKDLGISGLVGMKEVFSAVKWS
ncbi:HSCARG dehydrogenase [Penicillium fimorum]|uniref:HSCARG dehydrogenase n=1 Tax=Penicillium fimorum TaxID=1882269 RepID=A0A9W9XWD1_9EURO|nr:HSCARG dehydrogenase [Penicillium fimorum]